MEHELSGPAPKTNTPSTPLPSRVRKPAPPVPSIGNHAAARIIQAKLNINQPGDPYETEADQVADRIAHEPAGNITAVPPAIQRACAHCEQEMKEEDQHVQTKSNGPPPAADPHMETAITNLRGGGESLPPPARAFFEPRFGRDFSDVRIHTSANAAESAKNLNALAFTAGSDIAFAEGRYSPETPAGQRLFAHELTHVVQQGHAGPSAVPVIQRQAAPETASPSGAGTALIVDDDAPQISPGQMRKTEFLSRVRTEVCRQSEEAMKGTGRTTEGCPYVDRWFGHYAEKDSRYIERSLKKFAPEAGGTVTAAEYIPIVAARVRRSVEVWAQTGEITGVPDELVGAVMGGEILGSIGRVLSGIGPVIGSVASGIVSGIGSIVSGIGRLFSKTKDGGRPAGADARSVADGLSCGHGLESGVRQRMETAFGHDFSSVRVHTGSRAADASEALTARAFTVGSAIAFGPGEYQPGTMIGEALIAHELAHVVQQGTQALPIRSVRPPGLPTSNSFASSEGGVPAQFAALEQDADTSAVKAVASSWFGKESLPGDVLPKIKSGLRLQRCPKSVPKPPPLNLFAPEFGATPAQALAEAEAVKKGKERFDKDPDTYDADFVPDVIVALQTEAYCYNFRYQDVDDVCLPPEPGTAGCVMVSAPSYTMKVDVQQRQQKLGTDSINSPLSVSVTTFPIRFTAYVQTNEIKENQPLSKNSTMSEELQHIVDDFNLMQSYKERLARVIRLRLVQARQQAARDPKNAEALIGRKAIEKMVSEEEARFGASLPVQRGLNTKSVHERVDTGKLGAVNLPPAFNMPPIKVGAAGSLTGDDKSCR